MRTLPALLIALIAISTFSCSGLNTHRKVSSRAYSIFSTQGVEKAEQQANDRLRAARAEVNARSGAFVLTISSDEFRSDFDELRRPASGAIEGVEAIVPRAENLQTLLSFESSADQDKLRDARVVGLDRFSGGT